jgi:hypothetical protein
MTAFASSSDDRLPIPSSVATCISIESAAIASVTRANASTGAAFQTCAEMSRIARFTSRDPSEI